MNRVLPPVIPAQAGIYSPPLYHSAMERGLGGEATALHVEIGQLVRVLG